MWRQSASCVRVQAPLLLHPVVLWKPSRSIGLCRAQSHTRPGVMDGWNRSYTCTGISVTVDISGGIHRVGISISWISTFKNSRNSTAVPLPLISNKMTIKSSSSRLFLQPYRLSALQRAALIPYFGAASLLVPERGDYVAGFADLTAGPMLRILVKRIPTTVEGRNLLKNKPLISEVSLNMPRLRDLPSDTLGHQYARYMDQYEFSANERSKVRFMMNAEEAYVMTRYRQVHDFWHVLSGLPPTVMGELALKFLEFRVTGAVCRYIVALL